MNEMVNNGFVKKTVEMVSKGAKLVAETAAENKGALTIVAIGFGAALVKNAVKDHNAAVKKVTETVVETVAETVTEEKPFFDKAKEAVSDALKYSETSELR